MKELIIGILTLLGALLTALLKGSYSREKRLKEEKKESETELYLLKSQMETINECKKDLGLIDKEDKETRPEVKEAPISGDVTSRLERLNSLHEHSKSN